MSVGPEGTPDGLDERCRGLWLDRRVQGTDAGSSVEDGFVANWSKIWMIRRKTASQWSLGWMGQNGLEASQSRDSVATACLMGMNIKRSSVEQRKKHSKQVSGRAQRLNERSSSNDEPYHTFFPAVTMFGCCLTPSNSG